MTSRKNSTGWRSARTALAACALAAASGSAAGIAGAAEPAAPAAAAPAPAAATVKADDPMCVVSVQPEVKSVTFVSPTAGPESGALSMFLATAPTVKTGDLVRIVRKPGAAPTLETVEAGAAACQELSKGAEAHHADH